MRGRCAITHRRSRGTTRNASRDPKPPTNKEINILSVSQLAESGGPRGSRTSYDSTDRDFLAAGACRAAAAGWPHSHMRSTHPHAHSGQPYAPTVAAKLRSSGMERRFAVWT